MHVLDAGRVQRPLGAVQRSSRAVADDLLAEPRAERARRPPRRPRSSTARSPGRSRRRACRRRARATAVLRRSRPSRPRQPTCSAADRRRGSPFARAIATGRQSAVKTSSGCPGVVGPEPVARLARRRPARRTAAPVHLPAVAAGAPASVPTSAHKRRAVLPDVLGVVVGQPAEVERVERRRR